MCTSSGTSLSPRQDPIRNSTRCHRTEVFNAVGHDHQEAYISDGLRNPQPYIYFCSYFITVTLLLSEASAPKIIGNMCFLMVETNRLGNAAIEGDAFYDSPMEHSSDRCFLVSFSYTTTICQNESLLWSLGTSSRCVPSKAALESWSPGVKVWLQNMGWES